MFVRKKKERDWVCVFEKHVCVSVCVKEKREGGRYEGKEKELWAGEEGDRERNEMEGLKDKERRGGEGREGEREIE